jgi:hypothetical protein
MGPICQKEEYECLSVLVLLRKNLLGKGKPTGPVCGQTGKPQDTGTKYHTGWSIKVPYRETLFV